MGSVHEKRQQLAALESPWGRACQVGWPGKEGKDSKKVKKKVKCGDVGGGGTGNMCDLTLHPSTTPMPHVPSFCPGKHWRLRSDGNEQHLRVKHVFLHPLYHPTTFENDVALVELSEGPVLNDFVMPICLPHRPPQEGTALASAPASAPASAEQQRPHRDLWASVRLWRTA